MYRFPKILTRIRIFKCRLGIKVENNRPLINDEDDLRIDVEKIWWNDTAKQIVVLTKR